MFGENHPSAEQIAAINNDPEVRRLLAAAEGYEPFDPFLSHEKNPLGDLVSYLITHYPESAFEWIKNRGDNDEALGLLREFASAQATLNPAGAWRLLERLPSDSHRRVYFYNLVEHEMQPSLMAAHVVDRIWEASARHRMWLDYNGFTDIVRKDSSADPVAAWVRLERYGFVEKPQEGDNGREVDANGNEKPAMSLTSFLEYHMELGPEQPYPIELLKKLEPDRTEDMTIQAVRKCTTAANFAPLLEWVNALPPGEENSSYYESVGYWFAKHDDVGEAVKWINRTQLRVRWDFLSWARNNGHDVIDQVQVPVINSLEDLDRLNR